MKCSKFKGMEKAKKKNRVERDVEREKKKGNRFC